MASVTDNHTADIVKTVFSPFSLAEELPAGHFGKYEKTYLVTALKEMNGIGIMSCSYNITTESIFHKDGIGSLSGGRHCISHIRIALMAVKTEKLYLSAVENKARSCKLCFPEAEALDNFIILIGNS